MRNHPDVRRSRDVGPRSWDLGSGKMIDNSDEIGLTEITTNHEDRDDNENALYWT